MTLRCGVFGHPLGHSISPVFQQAAFDALRLDVSYAAWDVEPALFPQRMRQLRQPEYLGANVTIPHKETALRLADSPTPLAAAIGAANTLVGRDSGLEAHNTDVYGFLKSLAVDGQFDAMGAHAIILGAGGAARAIVTALVLAGAGKISIANRHSERADSLATHVAGLGPALVRELRAYARGRVGVGARTTHETALAVVELGGEAFRRALGTATLIVNCTSVGMRGAQEDETPLPSAVDLRPDALVIDIVANPLRTRLMRDASERGLRVVGGLPMLIYQGAESFHIWTGQEPPVERMFEAAREYMARPR